MVSKAIMSNSGGRSESSFGDNPMQQNATGRHSEKNAANHGIAKPLNDKELSQRRQNAIPLLLQGMSDAEVAGQVGVDRVTVFRWRKHERFAREVERLRAVLVRSHMARVQGMLEPALEIVRKQLQSDDPKIQLRAAAMLLRLATPARLERAGKTAPDVKPPTFSDALTAYIEAPLPDDPRYAQYEAWRRERFKGIGPCTNDPDDDGEGE